MGLFFVRLIAESQRGVMARITGLLARKGYNLKSICAGKHLVSGEASVVMKIEGSEDEIMNAKNILSKVVEVISVSVFEVGSVVERELCLFKVSKDFDFKVFDGLNHRIVKDANDFFIVEAVDEPRLIDDAVGKAKEQGGLIDISRSGVNAL